MFYYLLEKQVRMGVEKGKKCTNEHINYSLLNLDSSDFPNWKPLISYPELCYLSVDRLEKEN